MITGSPTAIISAVRRLRVQAAWPASAKTAGVADDQS
jgi:hypothetical protein